MQVGTGTVYSDRCEADFAMSSATGIITPDLTLRYVVRSGFIDTYRAAAILIVNSNWLFQLGELGFGGDKNGDVGGSQVDR